MEVKSKIRRRLKSINHYKNGEIGFSTILSYLFLPSGIRPTAVTKKILDLRANQIGIYSDDVFLISYPHSGRTWSTCLLSNLKKPGSDWVGKDYEVPDYATDELVENASNIERPRIFVTHNLGLYEPYYSKGIYLYRDGRDVAVSIYKVFKRDGFKDSFNKFVKLYVKDGFDGSPAWHNHIKEYLFKEHTKPILPIRYEDLCEDPVEILQEITTFIGLETTNERIKDSIEQCSFTSYQKHTSNIGVKGGPGSWREYFDDELLSFYWNIAGETLSRLGYKK